MKNKAFYYSIILIIGLFLFSCQQNIKANKDIQAGNNNSLFHNFKGPYLGQTHPGDTAEFFAPGLLSAGGSVHHIIFSPDGKEVIYSILTPGSQYLVEPRGVFRKNFNMYSQMDTGCWTEPKAFLHNKNYQIGYRFFSPDGEKLFFNSNRGKTDPPDMSSSGMWFIERRNGEWSEPVKVEFEKNYQGGSGGFPSVAANGNLYFYTWSTGASHGHLRMSKYENGKYLNPVSLGETVNSPGGAHPYIAPDESYIIFDSYKMGGEEYGETDLFISYCDKKGNWTKPKNLGKKINSKYVERRPFVSSDGKYLFFASNRVNPELPTEPVTLKKIRELVNVPANGYQHIYWVDAKVIDRLRPEHLK
jgi:Tol biopolymer transport system component